MNLYQEHIYRSQLEHAMPMNPRKNHKYLYIDKNGNYVYPEDVKRKVAGGFKKAGKAVQNVYEDREIYKKAASNMYKDYGKMLENSKTRMKVEKQKQYEERAGKADKVKARNQQMLEGAKKIGKAILKGKTGRMIDVGTDLYGTGKDTVADYQKKDKARKAKIQKELDDRAKKSNDEMSKIIQAEQEKYAKKKAKDNIDKYLPEGWERKSDGYVYDDMGAIVSEEELAALRKKIAKK